jgi:hypothetical protein
LKTLIPHITTANSAIQCHKKIREHKLEVADGTAKAGLIPLTGVNISFSAKGLKKVSKPSPSRYSL